jgi:hypothetical protein
MSRLFSVLVLTFAILVARAVPAYADDAMSCEVVEIDATVSDKPSIDPSLKDLEKKLKKGPFAAYNTFVQSARMAKKLEVLKAQRFDTPKGAVNLIIREIARPSKKRARLALGIRLENEAGKEYMDTKMSVDGGDFLLFARTASEKQTTITAVGCR